MPKWRTIKPFTTFDFTVDEGKELLNPSHKKNKGMHRRRNVDDKSCVTQAGTSNELDVQNKWEENTHTHRWRIYFCTPYTSARRYCTVVQVVHDSA